MQSRPVYTYSIKSFIVFNLGFNSTLCRFGGDEFVLVFYQELPKKALSSLLNRIIASISEPYQDNQQNPRVLSASIGLSRFPNDGNDIENLIMRADAAMYQAKKSGKKRWVEYETGMEKELKRKIQIMKYLIYLIIIMRVKY